MKVIKKIQLLLIFLFAASAHANIAADQINAAMHTKKPQAEHAKTPYSIEDLQHNYRFIFFYRSTCPHCHKFAPILKDFSSYYHIPVSAYSTDGQDLDGLHGQKMTAEQYQDYFIQGGFKNVVPALFLQNKDTLQTYPVLFGEAQPYQLAERVSELVKHIKERMDA